MNKMPTLFLLATGALLMTSSSAIEANEQNEPRKRSSMLTGSTPAPKEADAEKQAAADAKKAAPAPAAVGHEQKAAGRKCKNARGQPAEC